MTIDWLHILEIVILVIAGYFVSYFKKKAELMAATEEVINTAESHYAEYTDAGSKKMALAIDLLYERVPAMLKPFITKEMLQSWIQKAFDQIKSFVDKQMDKVVDEVIG